MENSKKHGCQEKQGLEHQGPCTLHSGAGLDPEYHREATEDRRCGGQLGGYCSESGVRGNKTGKMRTEQRWSSQAVRCNQL